MGWVKERRRGVAVASGGEFKSSAGSGEENSRHEHGHHRVDGREVIYRLSGSSSTLRVSPRELNVFPIPRTRGCGKANPSESITMMFRVVVSFPRKKRLRTQPYPRISVPDHDSAAKHAEDLNSAIRKRDPGLPPSCQNVTMSC